MSHTSSADSGPSVWMVLPFCLRKCEERDPWSVLFFFFFSPFGVSSEARPAVPFVAHWLVNIQIPSLLVAADKRRLHIASVLSLVCRQRPVVLNTSNAPSFKGAFISKRLFRHIITAVNGSLPVVTKAAPVAVQAGLVLLESGVVSAGKII